VSDGNHSKTAASNAAAKARRKRIILHIGLHRTGSTSLQQFLADNLQQLRAKGCDVYRGQLEPNNHIELFLAAIRDDRDSFAKQKYGITTSEKYLNSVKKRVSAFVKNSPCDTIILTTEGLSLLRYPDELERLKTILDADNHDITVILVLRNRLDYLHSYKQQ